MEYTIITGATSGIGLELASIYAKNGHNLILVARRSDVLKQIKSDLKALYDVSIECFSCDLNDLEQVENLFKELNSTFNIHCLINNAGVGIFEPINEIKKEHLISQNNINFTSPVLITRCLIDRINENKGSIINICSILSYIPNQNKSVYVGNKHALLGFTNSIRLEFPNIHVLSVHPGTVKTSFFNEEYYKNKKTLDPKQVASKVFHGYKKRKRQINLPRSIYFMNLFYLLFPNRIDALNRKYFSNK